MAGNKQVLIEVKNIICSIVFSCPFYITVKQLCIDYRNIHGTDIPYQQFGYKTVLDFIKEISDVHMEWIPHLNDFMLRKNYISSTKHSQVSINERKTNDFNMEVKNSAIFSSQSLPENSCLSDRKFLVTSKITSTYSGFQNSILSNFLKNELCKLIPLKIKSQIRELLKAFPDGICLDDFTDFFKIYFQMDFPLERLGFHTLKDCLRCIPHIVEFDCENDSIVRSNSRKTFVKNDDISSKILNEKSDTELKSEVPYVTEENSDTKHKDDFKTIGYESKIMYNSDKNSSRKMTFNQELPHIAKFNNSIINNSDLQILQEQLVENKSKSLQTNHNRLYEENQNELCENWKESPTQFALKIKNWKTINRDSSDVEKSIETSVKDLKLYPNMHNNKTFLANDISDDLLKQEFKKVNTITDEVKQEFKEVLSSYPDGILASNFLEYYSTITKKYLLLSDFGFDNMIELAYSFPKIFKICHSYYSKCNCLLYSADRFKLNNFKSNFTCSNTYTISNHFDDLLKTNVMKLLAKLKKIHLKDFEEIYKITFKIELPWEYLGYEDIESFVLELADEIPVKLSSERDTFFISLNSERQFVESVNPIESSYKIHPDFVTPNDTYTTQLFPENLTKYIPICVTDTVNPDEIWIQLKSKTTSKALEILMKKLQIVYNDKEYDKYKMSEESYVVNNICAALWPFDDNWCRGIISKILPKDFVEIFYVDYGKNYIIQKQFLRLLKKEFLILPTQAIKGRLANIQPVNKMEWCNKAKQRLSELCISKPLIALVIDTHIKDRLSLCLYDVSSNEDIQINDVLIKENLAAPFNDLINLSTDQNFKSN